MFPQRIIYVAPPYPPNPVGADQILTQKLIHEFVAQGINITVVGVRYQEGNANAPEYLNQNGNPRVRWVGLRVGRSFYRRLRAWCRYKLLGLGTFDTDLSKVISELADQTHKQRNSSLLLSQFNPEDAIDLGFIFDEALGLPWVHIQNDPYPHHLNPTFQHKYAKPSGLEKNRINRRVGCALVKPNRVIFPCARGLAFQKRITPEAAKAASHRWTVIPHIGPSLLPSSKPDDGFIVCHVGRLYESRNPENFIRAWSRLYSEEARTCNLEYRQVGALGSPWLEAMRSCPGARLRQTVSHQESLTMMQRATSLLLIEQRMQEGIFLPSKLADYVAAERPILALSPANGTVADILEQYGGGIRADPDNAESIYQGLRTLYDHYRKHGDASWPRSSELASIFAPETICQQYLQVFAELEAELAS
jgi:glycosyltransferase involved in cell wall biosynthesis